MIQAVTCRRPNIVGSAVLSDYQLCVQSLSDIPKSGANPRKILENSWGKNFLSYAIRRHDGANVSGAVFKITGYERRLLDAWELTDKDWQNSTEVQVRLNSGRVVRARTQTLPDNHISGKAVNGLDYKSWLMPRTDFVRIASGSSVKYKSRVY